MLYVVAALTDGLDGYLARHNQQVTTFGKLMDATTDKVLIISLMVILASLPNFFPFILLICVVLTVAREFMMMGLRNIAASRSIVLQADQFGKMKTTIQLLTLGSFLLAIAINRSWEAVETARLVGRIFYGAGFAGILLSTFLAVSSWGLYLFKHPSLLK